MGDGLVLESGTHDQLLANENGAYSRLVNAQKLREAREKAVQPTDDSASDTAASGDEAQDADMEKQAQKEIPLGRSNTGRSLASEILEQREKEKVPKQQKYSFVYLFRRMGRINRDMWHQYLIGAIAAIRKFIYGLIELVINGYVR